MDLVIHSIADRPDLARHLDDFAGAWPTFMHHDPISRLFYQEEAIGYAEFCLVALDRDDPARALAKAGSIPFTWPWDPPPTGPAAGGPRTADPTPGNPAGGDPTAGSPGAGRGADSTGGLPVGGYDDVIRIATQDRLAGRRGNLVSAVEIAVQVDQRGKGLSGIMLRAMRANAARLGYTDLVAPVRPSAKHEVPHEAMESYLTRVRDDGLPADPWLRVHVRAGGRIVAVAPRSMTIAGTLAEWREWTGLPFDVTGPVVVPDALVPVHCDVTAGHAVYVEPNVWLHHRL